MARQSISPHGRRLNWFIKEMEETATKYERQRLPETYLALKRTQIDLAGYVREYAENKRQCREELMEELTKRGRRQAVLDNRIYIARKALDGTLQADERRNNDSEEEKGQEEEKAASSKSLANVASSERGRPLATATNNQVSQAAPVSDAPQSPSL